MAASFLHKEKPTRSLSEFEFLQDKGSRLGKGSFASVRLVKEKKTGKLFALKMININPTKVSKTTINNLQTEIQIHKQLDHPHIIKFHGHIQEAFNTYLVLDYAENGTLYDYLYKKKVLTPNEIFRFFYQTCLAIQYLHQNDILHRDLKPENLLLDKDLNIKLCDFGWAAKNIKEKRITFCGTFEYMAPEIVRKKPYDYRVDIWSLGVLLYELVHREAPYKGRTLAEIINSLLRTTLGFSSSIQTDVKDLIQKILKIDSNERISLQEILSNPWIKYHLFKIEYTQTPLYHSLKEKPLFTSKPESKISSMSSIPEQSLFIENKEIPSPPVLTLNSLELKEENPLLSPVGTNPVTPQQKVTIDLSMKTSLDNFYSNKGHAHSSTALPLNFMEKTILDSRKLSNDMSCKRLFETDIMSPDFKRKFSTIIEQLHVSSPTHRKEESISTILSARSYNQDKALNSLTNVEPTPTQTPKGKEHFVFPNNEEKISTPNEKNFYASLPIDKFRAQNPADSENLRNIMKTQDVPASPLPTFKISFSSKAKPDISKSNYHRCFGFGSTTIKPNESIQKINLTSLNDTMASNKKSRIDDKSTIEYYSNQSSSYGLENMKKLNLKMLDTTMINKAYMSTQGEKISRNKENRVETFRDSRSPHVFFEKLNSHR